ncbi:UDPglucose--hexose-1-phosphate uridylyltransferase [Phytomonospora endophytica]|uniref:Galactose-1-phosphate uridylyltransferase n=1 Tax=Phytomonospora endophytica TaxID=714109 RepID=A0A841FC40_9ACTN|nr:UDPglucose--hexose-1-phosphate uridylyltransferase [Phytomonospora endophytica]GIG70873.1 galactose-1-phosphate uridylyltransferase [Phytomonospora endophytica]
MSTLTSVHRSTTSLADGRELHYFDAVADSGRASFADGRTLPPRPPVGEMRYDALRDEWVAVAAHRQTRTFLPPASECPLCPSTASRSTEIPAPDYEVAVFENLFPSFSGPAGTTLDAAGPSPRRPAAGRCEVVCFTPDHGSSFASLEPRQVRVVMEAWADRTAALSELDGVEQVFCFENRGEEIGVTLHHPHGQIYGYPFVTPTTRRMLASAETHLLRTGRNLFADVLAAESAGERVVAANEHWTAFVPVAARWPFEVHLYPHSHVPDLPALSDMEREAFGPVYLEVLRRLDAVFGVPMPYISAWHQAPVRTGRDLSYAHLQLHSARRAPNKLKFLAGSESAMGAFVNDITPEQAARMLREAVL